MAKSEIIFHRLSIGMAKLKRNEFLLLLLLNNFLFVCLLNYAKHPTTIVNKEGIVAAPACIGSIGPTSIFIVVSHI